MIKRFTDYAANERTYLAWVRTAIAILLLGFAIEKLDIFFDQVAQQVSSDQKNVRPSIEGEVTGLAIIAVGTFLIIGATIRFRHLQKLIASEREEEEEMLAKGNLILDILVFVIAGFAAVYLFLKLAGLT
ncbi:MAG: DUF202 domain-containing protein [Verrucomicrobiota bacterium]